MPILLERKVIQLKYEYLYDQSQIEPVTLTLQVSIADPLSALETIYYS